MILNVKSFAHAAAYSGIIQTISSYTDCFNDSSATATTFTTSTTTATTTSTQSVLFVSVPSGFWGLVTKNTL